MTLMFHEKYRGATSSLNNDLLNDGVISEMYNRVVDRDIDTSFRFLCTQIQTPTFFFLEAQRLMLVMWMNGWVWCPKLEMKGWERCLSAGK